MHSFDELVNWSAGFSLNALGEAEARVIEVLQYSGATNLVKSLQMINLQKVMIAVGMFSIFEANIQDELGCSDGFHEVYKILEGECEHDLRKRFHQFNLAINVLKHGRGRSYQAILRDIDNMPFRVKRPDECFFEEGDVSEVSTLIKVDNEFIMGCAAIIRDVSRVLSRA